MIAVRKWGAQAGASAVLVTLGSGCPHPRVVAFAVDPPFVCPGGSAHVHWDVVGRASLRVQHGPNDWDDGLVPSTGDRLVAASSKTTVVLSALDADPNVEGGPKTKFIDVARKDAPPRGASAHCDASTRKCTGSIEVNDGDDPVLVRSISGPTITTAGATSPARICLQHPGLPGGFCVPANGSLDVPGPGIAATGTWTFETDLAAADPIPAANPTLEVTFSFGCP
jgi:hypothetical protein